MNMDVNVSLGRLYNPSLYNPRNGIPRSYEDSFFQLFGKHSEDFPSWLHSLHFHNSVKNSSFFTSLSSHVVIHFLDSDPLDWCQMRMDYQSDFNFVSLISKDVEPLKNIYLPTVFLWRGFCLLHWLISWLLVWCFQCLIFAVSYIF